MVVELVELAPVLVKAPDVVEHYFDGFIGGGHSGHWLILLGIRFNSL